MASSETRYVGEQICRKTGQILKNYYNLKDPKIQSAFKQFVDWAWKKPEQIQVESKQIENAQELIDLAFETYKTDFTKKIQDYTFSLQMVKQEYAMISKHIQKSERPKKEEEIINQKTQDEIFQEAEEKIKLDLDQDNEFRESTSFQEMFERWQKKVPNIAP